MRGEGGWRRPCDWQNVVQHPPHNPCPLALPSLFPPPSASVVTSSRRLRILLVSKLVRSRRWTLQQPPPPWPQMHTMVVVVAVVVSPPPASRSASTPPLPTGARSGGGRRVPAPRRAVPRRHPVGHWGRPLPPGGRHEGRAIAWGGPKLGESTSAGRTRRPFLYF